MPSTLTYGSEQDGREEGQLLLGCTPRSKILFEYTKFHIGVYLTLVTALVAVLGFGRANGWTAEPRLRIALFIPILCLVVAGIGE